MMQYRYYNPLTNEIYFDNIIDTSKYPSCVFHRAIDIFNGRQVYEADIFKDCKNNVWFSRLLSTGNKKEFVNINMKINRDPKCPRDFYWNYINCTKLTSLPEEAEYLGIASHTSYSYYIR